MDKTRIVWYTFSEVNIMLKTQLFAMQDIKYRDFHAKLMPTVSKDRVIGIRVPVLRKFSKEFFKTERATSFLDTLPHTYFEEDNVHAFLIEQIKDFNLCIQKTEAFLPFIDNWATCDMLRPKVFKKHKKELLPYVLRWLKSDKTYTVRFGIGMLLSFYLSEDFDPSFLKEVSKIQSDEYYINMMIAWYFATALALQYEHTIPYLAEKKLPLFVHNKTIQKAIESYRLSKETKDYLRTLKIK